MTLSLDAVPGVLEPPADAKPSRVWSPPPGWSRRRILTAIGGTAVAAGVAALDLLPWSKPRQAFAAKYTAWAGCRGFFNANTVCVPSNAYFNSQNCSGSWHRDDGQSGTCFSINWVHLAATCDGHNAWRWTGGGPNRKCSDGEYHYRDCGGGAIDRFSICRTAI